MTQLNISDIEDSYLNADLHEEWKKEFEEAFYKPLSTIVLMDIVSKITSEELAEIKEQDPLAWKDLMAAKEKYDKFQATKMKEE